MDMKKMGALLKMLRKEKEYTQEQLAEYLNVSNRTISRWETGTNLPDLDVLVLLSDFYGIEIRELIDGERKSEKMNKEQKDSIRKVAEYSNLKEKILIRRIILVVVLGIMAWCVSLVISLLFFNEVNGGIIDLILTLIGFVIYSSCVFVKKSNITANGLLLSFIGAFSAITVTNLLLLAVFFGSGSYHNYGIDGVWYAVGIFIATFLIAGITVSVINRKSYKKIEIIDDVQNNG